MNFVNWRIKWGIWLEIVSFSSCIAISYCNPDQHFLHPPRFLGCHNDLTVINLGDATNDVIQACSYQNIEIMSSSINDSILVAAVVVSLAVAQLPSYARDTCSSGLQLNLTDCPRRPYIIGSSRPSTHQRRLRRPITRSSAYLSHTKGGVLGFLGQFWQHYGL